MLTRAGILSDIPTMMELERSCPTAAHWTEQQYRQALESREIERLVLVAEDDSGSTMLGFLVALHVAPEWELENIVVAPASRRSGFATRLMTALLDQARQTNCEAVFLEVRESNAAARAFYMKFGFKETGRRKLYYANPSEDAITYRLKLF